MSEKTKKTLKYVSWGLVGVGTVSLICLGVTASDVKSGVALIDGVIIAVSALVAFITSTGKE